MSRHGEVRERVFAEAKRAYRNTGDLLHAGELARRSGLGSRQRVQYHLTQLMKDGRIGIPRGIDPVPVVRTPAAELGRKLLRMLIDLEDGDSVDLVAARESVPVWRTRILARWLDDAVRNVDASGLDVLLERAFG